LALTPGTRLRVYEILAAIGAGGMGEVYRARDTRLGRDVAIKVLHAADPEGLARFEREAQVLASLNHSNIAHIHGVEESTGVLALVMELVEGPTLADRIAKGPIPLDEAVSVAKQIADGLEAAHEQGIIHRDLKPANIKVRDAETVKILDFGLAKVLRDERPVVDAQTRVASGPLSAVGVLLGTVQYMAPEQIEGGAVDRRTDVFAFGAVMYEMVSGRKAFEAPSSPGLISAILRDPVPTLADRDSRIPSALDRVIQTCVAKRPDERFASMHDVGIALDWLARDLSSLRSSKIAAAPVPPRRRSFWWIAATLAAVAILAVGYLAGRFKGGPTHESSTYVYDIDLPPDTQHLAGIALSPDGRTLVLSTQPRSISAQANHLWIRDLSAVDWQPFFTGMGNDMPAYPFWSPDSRSLAFFNRGKLLRVDLPNFAPIPLCDAPDGRGGAWLPDGTIVFAPSAASGLMRVSASGGTPELLLERRAGETGLKFPVGVGRDVLFWAQHSNPSQSELRLMRAADPQQVVPIVRTAASGVYDGANLFYVREGALVGQPFDAASGRLGNTISRVAVDRFWQANVGSSPISAVDGLQAVANQTPALSRLRWVDRTGAAIADVGEPASNTNIDISPNARRIAVERTIAGERDFSIWVIDTDTGAARRAVDGDAQDPIWAPDSRRLAFRSLRGLGGNGNLYQVDVDAGGAVSAIFEAVASLDPGGWMPDGAFLFFNRSTTAELAGGILIRRPRGEIITVGRESGFLRGRVSPDGRRIARESVATGQPEIVIDSTESTSAHLTQISRGGGTLPRWRADGRELFYIAGDNLMAADTSDRDAAVVSTPRSLFKLPSPAYAVHPDGRRFLVLVPTSSGSSTVRITLRAQR